MSTIVRTAGGDAISSAAFTVLAATGDGVTDDAPSIRTQLAAASPGVTIYGIPGRTYLVGTPLTASTFKVPSGTTSMPYVLAIPSGVTLDLRGATLKLKAGTDAVMVTNAGALTGSPGDTDVGLVNAVLDGNNVTLTNKALLMWTGITRPHLACKIINGNHLGAQINNVSHGDFLFLEADGVLGNPFSLGTKTPAGQDVRDCRFGTIRVRNVTPDPANTFNMPGNSIAGVFQRCTFDLIEARNCTAGIKIEDPSSDLAIGRVLTDSCGDTGGNSGLKLQGASASATVNRVTVGAVVATNQTGHGLWMEHSADCHIGSYTGRGNMLNGTGPDVWVGGARDTISAINSTNAGGNGIHIRSYATDFRLGAVTVRNPGQVSAATSKAAISAAGGTGAFASITAVDDQATATMPRGVDITGAAATIRCPLVFVRGATVAAVSIVGGGSTTLATHVSGNPTYAELLPGGWT